MPVRVVVGHRTQQQAPDLKAGRPDSPDLRALKNSAATSCFGLGPAGAPAPNAATLQVAATTFCLCPQPSARAWLWRQWPLHGVWPFLGPGVRGWRDHSQSNSAWQGQSAEWWTKLKAATILAPFPTIGPPMPYIISLFVTCSVCQAALITSLSVVCLRRVCLSNNLPALCDSVGPLLACLLAHLLHSFLSCPALYHYKATVLLYTEKRKLFPVRKSYQAIVASIIAASSIELQEEGADLAL